MNEKKEKKENINNDKDNTVTICLFRKRLSLVYITGLFEKAFSQKMQMLRSWTSFSQFNNSLHFNTLVDV